MREREKKLSQSGFTAGWLKSTMAIYIDYTPALVICYIPRKIDGKIGRTFTDDQIKVSG